MSTNVQPTISGAVLGRQTGDTTPIAPFSGVTIADTNAGLTETVTITLSATANGTVTNLGGGSYDAINGVYSDSGTAAAVTAALDALIFTPTAHQTPAGQTVTTTFTIGDVNSAGVSATTATASVQASKFSPPGNGLLDSITVAQQLELIYVAYFDRAADGGGYAFWTDQNSKAQTAGQSAATALSNIANSFVPHPETIALYPFLDRFGLDLTTQAGQDGLNSVVSSIYFNLFDRAADAAGKAYWVGQLTKGAVGLGAAALAIANGATGTDATELLNKLTVALDFTTKTSSAGLGMTATLPNSFVLAAGNVLAQVDGVSLNDASVATAKAATVSYIAGAATGHQAAAFAADPAVITITATDQVIDPGSGARTIEFLPGAGADTLVPGADSVDQIFGFDPATDVLDLRSAFAGRPTITDQGADAMVSLPGGATIAVLHGLGGVSLDTLRNAIRATAAIPSSSG